MALICGLVAQIEIDSVLGREGEEGGLNGVSPQIESGLEHVQELQELQRRSEGDFYSS